MVATSASEKPGGTAAAAGATGATATKPALRSDAQASQECHGRSRE